MMNLSKLEPDIYYVIPDNDYLTPDLSATPVEFKVGSSGLLRRDYGVVNRFDVVAVFPNVVLVAWHGETVAWEVDHSKFRWLS